MTKTLLNTLARLPARAPKPVRTALERVAGQSLAHAADRVLRQEIEAGDFDFLEGRCLAVRVLDAGFLWPLSLQRGRLRLLAPEAVPEATISGNTTDLLLLASRREDPDSLFFRRRLRIEGDTELGLHVKNVLDRLELDQLPPPLRWGLERAGEFVQKGE